MKQSRFSPRKALLAAAFLGVMAFGGVQAIASGTASQAQARQCSSICEPDCQGFGGTYRAGVCWCCG